jgi:protein gp37
MANRLQSMGVKGYENGFEVTIHPEQTKEPLKWKKSKRIFVCSMGDLFHDEVPFNYIAKVWDTMYDCSFQAEDNGMMFPPYHTFLILTKRPERMAEFYQWMHDVQNRRADFPNLWLGVTAENQEQADKRIPILLSIPAEVHFVSAEPMLSGISVEKYFKQGLSWVICGCESGSNRRWTNPDVMRDLKNQCVTDNVPFFLKQMNQEKERGYPKMPKVIKMPELDGKIWAEYPKGN